MGSVLDSAQQGVASDRLSRSQWVTMIVLTVSTFVVLLDASAVYIAISTALLGCVAVALFAAVVAVRFAPLGGLDHRYRDRAAASAVSDSATQNRPDHRWTPSRYGKER